MGEGKGRERKMEGKRRSDGKQWRVGEGLGPKYVGLEPPLANSAQRIAKY